MSLDFDTAKTVVWGKACVPIAWRACAHALATQMSHTPRPVPPREKCPIKTKVSASDNCAMGGALKEMVVRASRVATALARPRFVPQIKLLLHLEDMTVQVTEQD